MRALPIAVVTAAAALMLTACDSGGADKKESGGSTATSASSTVCAIDRIDFEVGPANTAPAAGDTGNVPVTLTNHGDKCTLEGFPGIEVHDSARGTEVFADKSAKPQKVTLAKDGTASFTITYVRGAAGAAKSLAATSLKISLPGAKDAQRFKWSYGPLAGKTGPDDLNASVSTFQAAGD
ncbi:DUF4232 domain-containing protein [Streptomyces sp. LN704]|uniref:DUF4232 domain-containing protein n=1 Tax=Streptomyces sp. LN704 TaxID=3112982 RepID=UPI0037134118